MTDEKQTPDTSFDPRYLGDGVYASFDDFQIWLHVGSHDAPGLVAMDQKVFDALCAYAKYIWGPMS